MKRILTVLLFVFGFATQGFSAQDIDIRLVSELYKMEVYEGQTFHDGHLWVGNSRTGTEKYHFINVFDGEGKNLVKKITLKHSASFIYPYTKNAVIVVGRSSTPYWLTHYTVITRSRGTFSSRTYTFSQQYMVDRHMSHQGKLFFSEPGSRGVYELRSGSMRKIPTDVSNPGQMVSAGQNLWIIERRSGDFGDESLVKFNVSQNRVERIFDNDWRLGISNISFVADKNWLVANEFGANKLLFIDAKSNELAHEVSVNGSPRGMIQLGSCLITVSDDTKILTFISLWQDQPEILEEWDLSAAGDRLKQPRSLQINEETGTIFVRSNYPCPSCSVTQSSVFAIREAKMESISKCKAN